MGYGVSFRTSVPTFKKPSRVSELSLYPIILVQTLPLYFDVLKQQLQAWNKAPSKPARAGA